MKLAKYFTNIFIRQTQMANRHMKRMININCYEEIKTTGKYHITATHWRDSVGEECWTFTHFGDEN